MVRQSLLVVVGVGLCILPNRAHAQGAHDNIAIASFNPEDAVAPVSAVEGPGIKVGEGTVLHPVFGIETGLVSNVFYTDTGITNAALLRLIAQISTASLSTARLQPTTPSDADDPQENVGSIQYRADARLSYDQMLSGNGTVRGTSGLGAGLAFHGLFNANGPLSFGIDEDYARLIRAANFETDANTNRDVNNMRAMLLYHPHGRNLSGYLYYRNTLDIFERGEQSFADRMMHTFGLHPMWRVWPQTMAYLELNWGITHSLGSDSMKVTSYPLQARAGIATLLSLNMTLNLDAGYTNGFYSRGPNFSAPVIGAAFGYRYSPLGRAMIGYSLTYTDSINANYYRDHVIRGGLQQLLNPVVLMVQPEIHFRQYNGVLFAVPDIMAPDTRNDTIVSVIAGVHYNFRNWIAATVNYRFSSVFTDFRYVAQGIVDDPSYSRHELLLGMRAAL